MGLASSTAAVVNMVNKDKKLPQPTVDTITDHINELQEMSKGKMQLFYDEILLQAGKDPNHGEIPVSSVVDKVQEVYVVDKEKVKDTLKTAIVKVLNDLMDCRWKYAIKDLVEGALQEFLGSEDGSASGVAEEFTSYHIVWANGTLIRIDTHVTKTALQKLSAIENSSLLFGGYITITSTVDIKKVKKEVLRYEIVRFAEKVKKLDPDIYNEMREEIKESDKVVAEVLGLD